jgi:hypothetical protein
MYIKKMSGKEIFYVFILETRSILHIMYSNGWIDVSLRLYKEPLLKGFLSLQTTKRCARQERRRQKVNAVAQIWLSERHSFEKNIRVMTEIEGQT